VVVIRGHRAISMVPATALSQLIVFAAVAPFASWGAVDGHAVLLLAIFGVVQMAGGLAFFTAAARLIPVTDLTLLVLLEVVLGPLWVWIAFAERPSAATLLGGCGVVAAVTLQATGARPAVTAA
jgi:drug/metabolite transporter (DMT)-like permease